MRVHVERIVDARKKTVQCETPLGTLPIVWEGDPLPTSGLYDVELDVPSILEWGYEIWRTSDGPPADARGLATLTGTLVGFDELGVAEIEVREGFLLVETLGDPPLGAVGDRVELRPPEIHAYPYDL